MNSLYLTEAFKELNLLEEETFNLNSDEDQADFRELVASDDDVINIIDDDAETEEELEDSYVGKVVLDCDVCHSKIYKNPDEVIVSDDDTHANEGEECPYCYSTDGYKIIGQIEPYEEEAELKVEVEDKDGDDEEIEIEDDEQVDESLKKKSCKDCKEGCKDEELKEGFENVELETEDKIIKVSEEEKPEIPDAEMIAPLDDEAKIEITDSTEEANDDEGALDIESEDEVSDDEGEFIDQDFDEFEEDEFDELGESYLKKVYGNVDSFKTSKVSVKGNTLKLEGIIKFNSGNKKNTTFLFEAKDITKKGKIRFMGENLQISRGKKSFTLVGNVKDNKLIAESLNYNYRTKNENGKSIRLYGTVKR